jgi:hypothetical protein
LELVRFEDGNKFVDCFGDSGYPLGEIEDNFDMSEVALKVRM